jgi:hypothetical protein
MKQNAGVPTVKYEKPLAVSIQVDKCLLIVLYGLHIKNFLTAAVFYFGVPRKHLKFSKSYKLFL